MLPYLDFFEHHTPWYYYVLAPFLNWFDVAGSFDSAFHFLVLGRGLSLALTAIAIVLVTRLGRSLEGPGQKDRGLGLVAALLLAGQPFFLQKTLEARPDVPALVLLLAALALLQQGAKARPRARIAFFVLGGVGLGAAVMFTQKMLFVLPGALVGLGLWAWRGGRMPSPGTSAAGVDGVRAKALATLAFLVGVCLPGVLTWAAFAHRDAGGVFITNNFFLNARWKHFATNQVFRLIVTSWPVLSLALIGVLSFLRRDVVEVEGLLLLAIMVGLFLGVLVMPVPHRQYHLMALPMVCLFAARGLLAATDRVPERKRAAALAVALALLSILPVKALVEAYRDGNEGQLARLRTVFARTRPTDLVMDGWTGMGVFRPHAFHYFFLHEEAVAMLPPAALDAYLDAIEQGRGRPKLIALDDNLRSLGPRFMRFVEANYESTDGFFYAPRSDQPQGR